MASGKVHGLISGAAGVIAAWATYRITGDAIQGAAFGGACMAGILLSPDLDKKAPTKSHDGIQKGLGITIASVWWILWLPYAVIMKRHRAFLSHFPVVSTIGRIGYLGSVVGLILFIIAKLGVLASINGILAGLGAEFVFFQTIQAWSAVATSGETAWVWQGLIYVTVIIFALSMIGVDCEERVQKALFWIATGIGLAALAASSALEGWGDQSLSLWAWAFIGLSLSDTLHALVDWYVPEPGWNRRLVFMK